MKLEDLIEATMVIALSDRIEEEAKVSPEMSVFLANDQIRKTDLGVISKRIEEQYNNMKPAFPDITRTEAALAYFMERDFKTCFADKSLFEVKVKQERVH